MISPYLVHNFYVHILMFDELHEYTNLFVRWQMVVQFQIDSLPQLFLQLVSTHKWEHNVFSLAESQSTE